MRWEPGLQNVLGLAGLLIFYLVLGAVAPFIVDAHHAKEAIGYGLGWQGVFGQYAKPPASPVAEPQITEAVPESAPAS